MVHSNDKNNSTCLEIRSRLRAYINIELPDAEMNEVNEHLLDCQSCAQQLSELMLEDISDEAILANPLPVPLPPISLYDDFVRAQRLGALWANVRKALSEGREWAAGLAKEIGGAIEQSFFPDAPLAVGSASAPIRATGVEEEPSAAPIKLEAVALSPQWEPTSDRVACIVEEPPTVKSGTFRMVVSTRQTAYAGSEVFCTLLRESRPVVSFSGKFELRGGACRAETVGEGIPIGDGEISLENVELKVASAASGI
jgi:hypothetical protein